MDFSLKDVRLESLERLIDLYGDKNMVVELMVHPGYIDSYTRNITSYLLREEELEILIKAKNIGLFDSVQLISFSQF